MPKIGYEIKKKRKQRKRMIIILSLLFVFFIAAMSRIGVGDAEWAGMTVSNITPTLRMEFNVPDDEQGVLVNWVEEEAYYSGMKEGDFVKAINNEKVKNIAEFLHVAKKYDVKDGVLLDLLRDREPLFITLKDVHGLHGQIKEMILGSSEPVSNMPKKGSSKTPLTDGMLQVALTNQTAPVSASLPTPKEQGAADKILVEGHWLGMELIPLTPELAIENKIDPKTKGLLVDEISLEAAESGLLAGDMIQAINGRATPDLIAFTEATRRVKNKKKAEMLVNRRGTLIKIIITSKRTLGFSQNEAAQPIMPGALSPHKDMGKPCTSCHIIMKTGGQLATDAGDILPNPPPITKGSVMPHRYRGECKNCHIILK
ncbi:MAG: magnetochrome domain-containing protein [Candidatus Omnitrophica bacterium]|nr:magnetochrome domain-containing protein [Candidatus Omnitrophota bacterium]